ncbi:MAG: PEP-CTERM sorting domain-containing protein [Candidatus Helarchaeota archaeon]|nr:PEP-CTERM sorting domain-containing protein [Candidatus Helarchaeota archaeon]
MKTTKKSAVLASIFRTVLTLCVFSFLFEPAGETAPITQIRSWADMPTNSITLYPDPYLAPSELAVYGITKESWFNGTGWVAGNGGAVSNFFSSNLSSQIAPFGNSLDDAGLRLTFSTPIYAFGATLIATQFPYVDNPADSFDNNEQNVAYQLVAYDKAGNIIGSVNSSSYGLIVGPVEYHTTYRGTEFMASYAGLSTDVPIYQLTILGARPSDGELASAVGSFSFSPTPVPEPSTMLLLGSGLIGLWGFRKKFKK